MTQQTEYGFTLVEALMVIVITGILAGMIAVFIRVPMDSYVATARRAVLTDSADTAVRRLARDIRLALPNSIRNASNSTQCIEFIPTKLGGRYRSAVDSTNGNGGNVLGFTGINTNFDMLWPNDGSLPSQYGIVAGDVIVVYNDGTAKGNAYLGTNAIQVSSVSTATAPNSTTITLVSTTAAVPFNNKQLTSASPESQFQVIPTQTHVVSYYCLNSTLYRYTRTLTAAWPLPADCPTMTGGATAAVLATNVNMSNCSFKYDPPGSSTGLSRSGIVSISLGITQSGESVNLYYETHVNNTP